MHGFRFRCRSRSRYRHRHGHRHRHRCCKRRTGVSLCVRLRACSCSCACACACMGVRARVWVCTSKRVGACVWNSTAERAGSGPACPSAPQVPTIGMRSSRGQVTVPSRARSVRRAWTRDSKKRGKFKAPLLSLVCLKLRSSFSLCLLHPPVISPDFFLESVYSHLVSPAHLPAVYIYIYIYIYIGRLDWLHPRRHQRPPRGCRAAARQRGRREPGGACECLRCPEDNGL